MFPLYFLPYVFMFCVCIISTMQQSVVQVTEKRSLQGKLLATETSLINVALEHDICQVLSLQIPEVFLYGLHT